jgi:hypothetical protein
VSETATRTPTEMFDAFVNGRLTKPEWTHEAHLITCWVALQDRGPGETLGFLREAIKAHNCGIAIRNTETSGYHETLTRYYVTAVAAAMQVDPSLDHVLADPACGRSAWEAFWSRDHMFTVEARLGWAPPDRGEPPWPIVTDDDHEGA